VPHRARPIHNAQHPVHVTLRVVAGVPSLRRRDLFAAILGSIAATNQSECPRLGDRTFRIVHFSVQTNYIHLIVEAEDKPTLRAGLMSLSIRAARGVNKARGKTGKVWGMRYFARPLTAPRDEGTRAILSSPLRGGRGSMRLRAVASNRGAPSQTRNLHQNAPPSA